MNDRKKILVTGGSGFIGTNVVRHFCENFDVLNLDANAPKNAEDKPLWRKVDITDLDSVRAAVLQYNPDYILHLAARTDLEGKTLGDYSANTDGVKNILAAAKELPGLKKIIVTSSMLVCRPGYIPAHQCDYSPTTMYGRSKIETEKLTWSAGIQCDWCLIRPSSIWGEFFGVPYRNFFDMVLARRYFHIGRKGCTKTYGYIGNAVHEIEKLLFAPTGDSDNKVFYIGDYEPTNIETWADEIACEAYGGKVRRLPMALVWALAKAGDLLGMAGVRFPMTSFRLHNMTTNNIVPLSNTEKIVGPLPYSRIEGVRRTLEWMAKRGGVR